MAWLGFVREANKRALQARSLHARLPHVLALVLILMFRVELYKTPRETQVVHRYAHLGFSVKLIQNSIKAGALT